MMKKYFENDDILALIWRWKKELSIITLTALIISAFISSPIVIKPKFKSYAKAYPSNLTKYSDESPTEQMLQLLESDVIRDQIIEEFNLAKHYDIKDDNKHRINKLFEKYNENFSFNKNKFEAVEVEVTDESPDTAFLLATRVMELYNEQVKRIQDAQTKESVATLKKMVANKKLEMDSLERDIQVLNKEFKILDYDAQVENLTKEYYKLLGRRYYDPDKKNELETELKQIQEKGVEFKRLNSALYNVRNEYTQFKLDYEQQLKELSRNKSYANVVVNPFRSDKKVYPIRWLIVGLSVSICLIVSLGIISFIDRIDRTQV